MKFVETCEEVFNEIQQLRRDVLTGKISSDTYALQMGGISQLEKQQKLMLGGFVAESRLKRKVPVNLNRGVVAIEEERHNCIDRDMIVTRSECLEYSGNEKNIESCRSCKDFKVTRNLLLGEKAK